MMSYLRYWTAVFLVEKAQRNLENAIKLRMCYPPGSSVLEFAELHEALAELWITMAKGVYPEWPTEPPKWYLRLSPGWWKRLGKMLLVLVGLTMLLGGSTRPSGLVPLECRSPWIVMSPGLETAMDARVNLDQEGTWIIQAEHWLVIWSPERAVAAHDWDAWEAEVFLASSDDPAVCGYVQVLMGERILIPEFIDSVDF